MSKIGRSVTLKQKDVGPYYVIGIAVTDEGFEIRKIKMSGDEVESFTVVSRTDLKPEAMQRLQMEVQSYIINFNQTQLGGE